MPAPIVLFVFNRPDHACQTIEALGRNTLAGESTLYIFSDGPRDEASRAGVEAVREYIRTLTSSGRFGSVVIREAQENLGLARSVIQGVSEVIGEHGRVIVLEDDLVTASGFLEFMNTCLKYYEDNPKVGSISGYSPLVKLPEDYPHDVYKVMRNSSHGWATWKDRWDAIDWEIRDYDNFRKSLLAKWRFDRCGSDRTDRLRRQMQQDIDSWSIRFGYNLFRRNQYTIYPAENRVRNIGRDSSGVHATTGAIFNDTLAESGKAFHLVYPPLNQSIERQFRKIYSGSIQSRIARFLRNYGLGKIEWFGRQLYNGKEK